MSTYASIEDLLGKTITRIEGADKHSGLVVFYCDDGSVYRMYHYQDCCESVLVEDVAGDVTDLIGTQILQASEETNDDSQFNPILNTSRRLRIINPCDYLEDSYTWTFYKLATINGYVTIRWYGTSNGYYSESVSFEKVD